MKPPTRMPPESRRTARRAVELICEVIAPHEDQPEQALCTDLSEHGMSLLTDVPLDVGDIVSVCIKPPTHSIRLTLFGQVRRSFLDLDAEQFDTGIEFVNISAFERKTLRDALVGLPPRLPRARAS